MAQAMAYKYRHNNELSSYEELTAVLRNTEITSPLLALVLPDMAVLSERGSGVTVVYFGQEFKPLGEKTYNYGILIINQLNLV